MSSLPRVAAGRLPPVSRVAGQVPRFDESRGTVNSWKAVAVRAYCSCGHLVDEHLGRAGQCRASDDGERCTCQSVDVEEAE